MDSGVDERIELYLKMPYWIIDFIPKQVPAFCFGQYSDIEKYYLEEEQLKRLRKAYAEMMLVLNCYMDMDVQMGAVWMRNPDPDSFIRIFMNVQRNHLIRILFEQESLMFDYFGCDTYMTVYHQYENCRDLLEKIALAKGVFLFDVPKEE